MDTSVITNTAQRTQTVGITLAVMACLGAVLLVMPGLSLAVSSISVLSMAGLVLYVSSKQPRRRNHHRFSVPGVFLSLPLLSACSELPYNNLDNMQLQTMLEQDVPIYDVRRPEEWRQTGVVEGSRLLTFVDASGRLMPDFLPSFSSVVAKDDPVILICTTGSRTGTLARLLVEQLGYTNVYNVRHGISEWIRDDRPIRRL